MVFMFASLMFAAVAEATRARFLMGTVCEMTAPPALIEPAFREADRIEKFLSTWRPDSELSRVNAAGGGVVSPELAAILTRSMKIARDTDGAFNPLARPIVDAWRTRDRGAIPSDAAIADAVARANLANATIAGNTVALANGAQFEEGGFGKGYALDRMLRCGAGNPAVVMNFGGQIALCGEARVTIADPERRDHPVLALTLHDASLSTSSGAEKTFDVNGTRFSHIVDPRTGRALPPRGSASVIATSAFDADALSTALFVMGAADGIRWADAHCVAAIFITPEHDIVFSAAMPRRGLEVLDSKFKLKE